MKISILTTLNDPESNSALQTSILEQIRLRNAQQSKFKIGITSLLSSETDQIRTAIKDKSVSILILEIDDPDVRWKMLLEARAAKIPVICLCHGRHVYTAAEKLNAVPVQARNRDFALSRVAFEVVTIVQTMEDVARA